MMLLMALIASGLAICRAIISSFTQTLELPADALSEKRYWHFDGDEAYSTP